MQKVDFGRNISKEKGKKRNMNRSFDYTLELPPHNGHKHHHLTIKIANPIPQLSGMNMIIFLCLINKMNK